MKMGHFDGISRLGALHLFGGKGRGGARTGPCDELKRGPLLVAPAMTMQDNSQQYLTCLLRILLPNQLKFSTQFASPECAPGATILHTVGQAVLKLEQFQDRAQRLCCLFH
jgi:hypothetical protein